MQFSAEILDLVSPSLSNLTACSAPEVAELSDYGSAFLLRQVVGEKRYKNPNVFVALSTFLVRLNTATRLYRDGRDHLMKYVAHLPKHQLAAHTQARSLFESCVVHTYIAHRSVLRAAKLIDGKIYYEETDEYRRLREVNNRIKHFDDDIDDAAVKNRLAVAAPVWLATDRLICETAELKYVELAEILAAQAEDAKTFTEKWLA